MLINMEGKLRECQLFKTVLTIKSGAIKMAWWIRELAALSQDLRSVPTIHRVAHNSLLLQLLRMQHPLLASTDTFTQGHMFTHAYKYKCLVGKNV